MASALVGFGGSRALSSSWGAAVSGVVASVVGAGRGVAVCSGAGASAFVRLACPSAVVFAPAFADARARCPRGRRRVCGPVPRLAPALVGWPSFPVPVPLVSCPRRRGVPVARPLVRGPKWRLRLAWACRAWCSGARRVFPICPRGVAARGCPRAVACGRRAGASCPRLRCFSFSFCPSFRLVCTQRDHQGCN